MTEKGTTVKRLALVAGTNRYLDEAINDLRYAQPDAHQVDKMLTRVGFDTRFLADPSHDLLWEELERCIRDLHPGDLFVLYFSGHGVEIGGQHLLLCANADERRLRYGRGGVWCDEIAERLSETGADRVLILDTCREPVRKRRGMVAEMKTVALRNLSLAGRSEEFEERGAVAILCSCDEGDAAQESRSLGQGLFSQALLDICRDAEQSRSRLQVDSGLQSRLRKRMKELARQYRLSTVQRPWVKAAGEAPVLIPAAAGKDGGAIQVASPPPPVLEPVWHISEERGPSSGMSLDELKAKAKSGEITRGTLVWSMEIGVWTAAGQVRQLTDSFAAVEKPRNPSEQAPPPVTEVPREGRDWSSPATGMEFVWMDILKVWVGRYQVTNGEYRRKESGHDSKDYRGYTLNGDRQPVVYVNYGDACEYAEWLTREDHAAGALPEEYRYRVPTGDEWMTFAQCGDGREYPWGDNWPPKSGEAGNYAGEETKKRLGLGVISGYRDGHMVTCDVEESWQNPWGLYGVGGNVWECTSEKPGGDFDAWRGASWDYPDRGGLRCSFRSGLASFRGNYGGFRLLLDKS